MTTLHEVRGAALSVRTEQEAIDFIDWCRYSMDFTAAPAEGLDVERLTNLVRAQRDAYKARHSTSRARDVGVAAFDVVLAAIAREYAKETSE